MNTVLKSIVIALAGGFAFAGSAQTLPQPYGAVPASSVVLADELYVHRLVVVFSDSPLETSFMRQMEILQPHLLDLQARDVLLVTDTDPQAGSELRKTLHPRGFSLVIMDKDGSVAIRKPLPWDAREISRSIDKFPSRLAEVLERNPAGR
ncbi:DUF4174 domain-containing protein [Cypionkella sp.]|uniref:DUF4174 domain-containing protein n=1 Tax=Cypionkella sp. TaxID=2811411 RepID=UPI002FDCDF9C